MVLVGGVEEDEQKKEKKNQIKKMVKNNFSCKSKSRKSENYEVGSFVGSVKKA